LIPTITLLVGTLPGALASALVIEVIFNIPGIGRLMFESILNADWAMVYPIVFITSVFTVILFLIGDILMAFLNPKIKLG
jgi:ABC-type dipeptide/oligopeptide/nickel transport system permease component